MHVDASLINHPLGLEPMPEQPVYTDLCQCVPFQPTPVACIVYNPPTLGEWLAFAGLLVLGGYAVYKLSEREQRPLRCSACNSAHHTAATCPHVGERQNFPAHVVKIGICRCCGHRFRKTQIHHYAGRADNTRGKEMCHRCHVRCGHNGHFQNRAVNPRYCRRS